MSDKITTKAAGVEPKIIGQKVGWLLIKEALRCAIYELALD